MSDINHKILALKYRPQIFKDLIGQEEMVQTINNSIKFGKLPNAYLLTGIRGVGKTTTARIIAKALNCNKKFDQEEKCKAGEFCHCNEIKNSNHIDVLEMDAASKTGIDDIRELIDSSKYNPTSAKYKIYIIDEIHMLSKQAFNGLLKTLEEPPQHLKFIFATTEVKKIPVTIISRCQRFDLHRVSINTLFNHLKKISSIENGKITDKALMLITQLAEGSVRDGLSLLDKALINQNATNKEIDDIFVRKMLGITERIKILELFKLIFDGDRKMAISHLRKIVDEGIEPIRFLNEFLEVIYLMERDKNLGDVSSDLSVSEAEQKMIHSISKDISSSTLTIFWQFIIKSLNELTMVANQIISLEMLVIRLIHLKGMPDYQEILELFNKNNIETGEEESKFDNTINTTEINLDSKPSSKTSNQIKNTIQTKPVLSSTKSTESAKEKDDIKTFEKLIELASKKGEMELKYDLEKNVNLVNFSQGAIDISFNENLGKNFIRNLTEKLFIWTGKRWIISLTREKGRKTHEESKLINEKKILEQAKQEKVYKRFQENFSDLELIKITDQNK